LHMGLRGKELEKRLLEKEEKTLSSNSKGGGLHSEKRESEGPYNIKIKEYWGTSQEERVGSRAVSGGKTSKRAQYAFTMTLTA